MTVLMPRKIKSIAATIYNRFMVGLLPERDTQNGTRMYSDSTDFLSKYKEKSVYIHRIRRIRGESVEDM